MEKTEKNILRIGTYFLVLGFICALLAPMFYSTTYNRDMDERAALDLLHLDVISIAAFLRNTNPPIWP